MSRWRALAREMGLLPDSTKPTKPTEPGPNEVSWVSWVSLRESEPSSSDVARALGLPVAKVREAVTFDAPPLDGEGLPFAACPACRGGLFWKPAALPFEGPGWACEACHPPPLDMWRHAVAVPVKGAL